MNSHSLFQSANNNSNQYGSEYSTPANENYGSPSSTYISCNDPNNYGSTQSTATQYGSSQSPYCNGNYQSSSQQYHSSQANNPHGFYKSNQQASSTQSCHHEPQLRCIIL